MKNYFPLFATLLFLAPIFSLAQGANPSHNCLVSLENNPELESIRGKVALAGLNQQSIEMLANKSKPTRNDRKVISKWNTYVKECLDLGKQYRKEHYSEQIQLAQAEAFNGFEILVQKLFERKLSYGAFAKARASELEKYNAKVQEITRNLERQQFLDTTVKIKPM